MVEHVYHPDRINYPLKRKGDKGSGEWQRLTWSQALDVVTDKLGDHREQYGAVNGAACQAIGCKSVSFLGFSGLVSKYGGQPPPAYSIIRN